MSKPNVRIQTGQNRIKNLLSTCWCWQPSFFGEGYCPSSPHGSTAESAKGFCEKELQSANRMREFQIKCNFLFCLYWNIQILTDEVNHEHKECQFLQALRFANRFSIAQTCLNFEKTVKFELYIPVLCRYLFDLITS